MTLQKDIEILELNVKEVGSKMPPDTLKALKTGIAAISRILTMRSYNINQALMPLPGEDSIENPGLSEAELKRIRESPLAREPKVQS